MRPLYTLIALTAVAGALWLWPTCTPPPKPLPRPVVQVVAAKTPPPAGREETTMSKLYARKFGSLGKDHHKEVLEAGRWTRYYAQKADVEPYMTTLLCQWHVESHYQNVPGEDGKSFGRTQTRYGYQAKLRTWWLAKGETLGMDSDISTQMAFGVAEFVEKKKYAKDNLWDTVRRYNGCGPRALNYARIVFKARQQIYGRSSPKERPAPCPRGVKKVKKPKHKENKYGHH
jgi:hypothetical protein